MQGLQYLHVIYLCLHVYLPVYCWLKKFLQVKRRTCQFFNKLKLAAESVIIKHFIPNKALCTYISAHNLEVESWVLDQNDEFVGSFL